MQPILVQEYVEQVELSVLIPSHFLSGIAIFPVAQRRNIHTGSLHLTQFLVTEFGVSQSLAN